MGFDTTKARVVVPPKGEKGAGDRDTKEGTRTLRKVAGSKPFAIDVGGDSLWEFR